MNIGELDCRIKIYREGTVTNSMNEEAPAQILLKEIWAKVEPRTGSLLTGRPADTMLSKTTHVIYVRAQALKDVTESCHIVYTDKNGTKHHFDIDYIPPVGRHQQFASIYVQEVR